MKHLTISILFAVLFLGGVGQIKGEPYSYSAVIASVEHVVEKPAVAMASKPTFTRGKVVGTDCRPDFDKSAAYTSETVGKDELLHHFKKAGIPEKHWDTFAAIAMSESIRGQISCHGDDYAPYYMQKAPNGQTWTYSLGLFQIRLIKEQIGTGQCRDETRLKDNIEQQVQCAWELSGHGNSFSIWSVTHTKRGKPYLNWMGKHWGAFSWDGRQWTGG